MAKNTNPVMDMFRSEAFDPSDPWGSALGAQFDIAECLTRHSGTVPEEWDYRPAASVQAGKDIVEDDSSYFALELDLMIRQGHVRNIIDAGNVLRRYVHICELAGHSY